MSRYNQIYIESYQDLIGRLFDKEITSDQRDKNALYNHSDYMIKDITIQVTESCNFACSYCYQHNKSQHAMSYEMAVKVVDNCLNDPDISNKLGVIINFIGGEPLLEIELIDKVCSYYFKKVSEKDIKLASRSMIAICSNGWLYFDTKVQEFIKKYHRNLSFSISIDGFKELHDSCRVTVGGLPTYDLCIKAAKHYMENYGYLGTKMTFAKENIMYASKGLINLFENGYQDVHCNCAYEPEWEVEDAKHLYNQFKIVADYIIDNDLEDKVYCSLFNEDYGKPLDLENEEDCRNWCGGNGEMLVIDYNGLWYPCLRYMPSSLAGKQEPIICGDIEHGIDHDILKKMQEVNVISCSTEECTNCPVAKGCSYCTAYNYEIFGTINKRVINICIMHKATSLINTYFYNKIYKKHNLGERLQVHLPEEEALKIISKEEYDMLINLSK